MDISALIRRAAKLYREAPAIRTDEITLSFEDFDEKTERLANGLRESGFEPGDRVGVLLPNSLEIVIAYYALAKAGLVRVPLDVRDTSDNHCYKLSDSEVRAVITDAAIDNKGIPEGLEVIDGRRMNELIDRSSSLPNPHRWQNNDLYRIGYTGGTTGRPKGVLLTHGIEIALIRNYMVDLLPDLREGDRMLHAAPMTHATGSFFLPHLIQGGCNFIMNRFNPSDFLRIVEQFKPTCTFLVPTMIALVVEQPNATPGLVPELRRLVYGASPISPSVLNKATEIFGPVLTQTYGQSEAPMSITLLSPEDHNRSGAAGRPYTFVEVEVHDESGVPVPSGQEGEVVVRGDIVTPGYLGRPEATANTLRGGWLHTGDIGRFDDEGFLYLLDRKNDMIISGGFNVYPREVEDVIMDHSAVAEAAVYGVQDDKWGQLVHAAVVVKHGVTVSEQEIIDHCAANLANYKKPRKVTTWNELPKSPAGKILRREVAAQMREMNVV